MKIIASSFLCLLVTSLLAQDHTKAAHTFFSALDNTQKKQVQYQYRDNERFNWNFVPMSRKGISFHDFDPNQRNAAMELLKASLSEQGFEKASGIIALEAILREVEGRSADDAYRDPLNYFFTIFGNPKSDSLWGWRIEGHHLALNFSSAKGKIVASTPSFNGANPAIVKSGSQRGLETLKKETALGLALINSLTPAQRKTAIFSETALPEIVTGNKRSIDLLIPRGIFYADLSLQQRGIFKELLQVYVNNYELGFSKTLWKKIERMGYDKLAFAWAGSVEKGGGHYYRIQGPALIIEYDNTQTDANHVHTVVRDLTNDFAEDILRDHYKNQHK